VVAIEQEVRKGPCKSFQAMVVDSDGPGMKLEHTLKLSEEEFRSLEGAQAALGTFYGEKKTEDEDDDGCLTCIRSIRSFLGSCLVRFLPGDRSLEFACAGGAAPPATISPATINTDTELLVPEDNVAPYPPRTLLLLISIMLAWS
jgi:hypothetical protein